jgi:hypothetical protein
MTDQQLKEFMYEQRRQTKLLTGILDIVALIPISVAQYSSPGADKSSLSDLTTKILVAKAKAND